MSRVSINPRSLQMRPTFPVSLLFLPGSGALLSALRFRKSSFLCNSSYKLKSLLRQRTFGDVHRCGIPLCCLSLDSVGSRKST